MRCDKCENELFILYACDVNSIAVQIIGRELTAVEISEVTHIFEQYIAWPEQVAEAIEIVIEDEQITCPSCDSKDTQVIDYETDCRIAKIRCYKCDYEWEQDVKTGKPIPKSE